MSTISHEMNSAYALFYIWVMLAALRKDVREGNTVNLLYALNRNIETLEEWLLGEWAPGLAAYHQARKENKMCPSVDPAGIGYCPVCEHPLPAPQAHHE